MMDQAAETPTRRAPMPSHCGRATLCTIGEELRCRILGFLSYDEILCCALICKTMYDTVKNSDELQYAIELGSQKLMPVHARTVSKAECLHILRNKANAWSSFDIKLDETKRLGVGTSRFHRKSITHQQLSLSVLSRQAHVQLSKVIDLRTCTAETASLPPSTCGMDSPDPVPGTSVCSRFTDDAQDLMITIKTPNDDFRASGFMYQIDFCTVSTGDEHPSAHESRLRLVGGKAATRVEDLRSHRAAGTVLGDRIAFYGAVTDASDHQRTDPYWSLHVWNWHQGGQPDDICVFGEDRQLFDIRFLTQEKLLALSSLGHIELYNVEDLSKPPQLQAKFMLPIKRQSFWFRFPSVFHSDSTCAHLAAPDERWVWTTNPADRVISVLTCSPWSIFVIPARLFFMDIPPAWFDATSEDARTVPWLSWGPQNSRCLAEYLGSCPVFGVGGTRVVRAVVYYPATLVHMTDFNPSAVARGIGEVVRKPETFSASLYGFTQDVTTYLPYVEKRSWREFDHCLSEIMEEQRSLDDIILDEQRVLISTRVTAEETGQIMDIEIIDM